jgi:hypothetical protein
VNEEGSESEVEEGVGQQQQQFIQQLMQNQDIHPFFNFKLSDMYPDYDDYEADEEGDGEEEEDDEDDENDSEEDDDKDEEGEEEEGDTAGEAEKDYIGFGDPPSSIIHPSSSKDSDSNMISSSMSEEIADEMGMAVTPNSQTGEGALDWKRSLQRSFGKQTRELNFVETESSFSPLSPSSANIYQKFLSDYPKEAMEEYFYDSGKEEAKQSDDEKASDVDEEDEDDDEKDEIEEEDCNVSGQSILREKKQRRKSDQRWKIC